MSAADCLAQAEIASACAELDTDPATREERLAIAETWLDLALIAELEQASPLVPLELLCELAEALTLRLR